MTEQAELGVERHTQPEHDIEERKRLEEEEEQQALDGVLVETPPSTALVESGPSRLIELAIQQDLDIDKLERLMAMKERWDAQKAKEAFYDALAQFQRIVPVLEKRNKVDFTTSKGRVYYAYASLADIKGQIQEGLSSCGLSYRWEFADLEVTCILSHTSGHSERTSMIAPADTSGSKNPVQERASTITYLQRYTLIGALGLATANMDDDGRQGKVASPTPQEAMKDLPDLPEGTGTKAPKPEANSKTDLEKQRQLYVYLCEIRGVKDHGIISDEDKKKLSDELAELTAFESDGEIKRERSLRNLKGKWLNTALGKAKAKLGHATARDELLSLIESPDFPKEHYDGMKKIANDKRLGEDKLLYNIGIAKGHIADADKEKE